MEFHLHPCFCMHLHLIVCVVLSTGIPCEENILPSTPSMSHGQFLAFLHRFPQSHFVFYFSIFASVNVGIFLFLYHLFGVYIVRFPLRKDIPIKLYLRHLSQVELMW